MRQHRRIHSNRVTAISNPLAGPRASFGGAYPVRASVVASIQPILKEAPLANTLLDSAHVRAGTPLYVRDHLQLEADT